MLARKNIRKTKLLFKQDPYNNTNVHKYIDEQPNILIIVRTETDRFIAGYSTDPCSVKASAIGPSILMSLTNKKCFKLLPEKKAFSYDKYNLCFGNSEIKLKTESTTVFSNFAINNSYFNA